MIYITGPGHGGPGAGRQHLPRRHLQRGLSRRRRDDARACGGCSRQFSFPGGIPSHGAPETPGSIHEGGELGLRAARTPTARRSTTPTCIVACVVGDGEAETGPLAASWHSNKFLNPARDGAVLPILHLNGYKIANPTRARAHPATTSSRSCCSGYGYEPLLRRGRRPGDDAPADGRDPRRGRSTSIARDPGSGARASGAAAAALADDRARARPRAGPGRTTSTASRSKARLALAPGAAGRTSRQRRSTSQLLEAWMHSYRPEELFDDDGALRADTAPRSRRGRAPHGRQPARQRRPAAATWRCPTSATTPSTVPAPGAVDAEATRRARRVPARRDAAERRDTTSALFGPDETASNRLGAVFDVDRPRRGWPRSTPDDDHLAPDGRVMEMLSEHLCQGWLEGYLLTGRHGLFSLLRGLHPHRRLDVQPARQVAEDDARHPVARADRVAELPADLARLAPGPQRLLATRTRASSTTSPTRRPRSSRVYLPPDANTPAARSTDHCLRSRNYVNVIVAGKQPAPQWLTMDAADRALRARAAASGTGPATTTASSRTWSMACAGDVPTLETLAAVDLLRGTLPDLKVRVVNVVDLMRLQPPREHPHGLPDDGLRRAVHHRQAGDLRLPRLSRG